jgi:hypothetical protein
VAKQIFISLNDKQVSLDDAKVFSVDVNNLLFSGEQNNTAFKLLSKVIGEKIGLKDNIDPNVALSYAYYAQKINQLKNKGNVKTNEPFVSIKDEQVLSLMEKRGVISPSRAVSIAIENSMSGVDLKKFKL